MPTLRALGGLKNVANVDLRVFWDDFFRRDRRFFYSVSKEDEDELQNLFIKELYQYVGAKSIAGYAKEKSMYVAVNKVHRT